MASPSSRFPAPPDGAETVSAGRRLALKRLGLAAGAAYLAPTVLGIYDAEAKDDDNNSGPGGPKWNKPSKPSKASKPSKPSKPSKT